MSPLPRMIIFVFTQIPRKIFLSNGRATLSARPFAHPRVVWWGNSSPPAVQWFPWERSRPLPPPLPALWGKSPWERGGEEERGLASEREAEEEWNAKPGFLAPLSKESSLISTVQFVFSKVPPPQAHRELEARMVSKFISVLLNTFGNKQS